ncbi:hypothetical protein NSTC731_00200 [Nostoc sp. DSM 114167]
MWGRHLAPQMDDLSEVPFFLRQKQACGVFGLTLKALFAEFSAINSVQSSDAAGERRNFLTDLLSTIITQERSHLRHHFAMASSMEYAIFSLH